MPVNQCAHFCNNPNEHHEKTVKRITIHLIKTRNKGLILRPDLAKGLECFVDADWAGSWLKNIYMTLSPHTHELVSL